METKKNHPPVVYRIYDELAKHQGKESAVPCLSLAQRYFPDMNTETAYRKVKAVIHTIRKDPTFDNVIISCPKGYYWVDKKNASVVIGIIFRHAIEHLNLVKSLSEKAKRDGQYIMPLTPYQREAVESLCGGDHGNV